MAGKWVEVFQLWVYVDAGKVFNWKCCIGSGGCAKMNRFGMVNGICPLRKFSDIWPFLLCMDDLASVMKIINTFFSEDILGEWIHTTEPGSRDLLLVD